MARIRTIKPEFWANGRVLQLSIPARLLFIGLWNFCDDHGHYPDRPIQIKASVFPGDRFSDRRIDSMLAEMAAAGLILRYRVNSQRYLEVTGWEHQKIDKRNDPKFPPPPPPVPDDDLFAGENSTNDRRPFATESIKEGIKEGSLSRKHTSGVFVARARDPKHMNGNGTDKSEKKKARRQIPADWKPDADGEVYAVDRKLSIDTELPAFKDHHRSRGNAFLDFPAAWRTWCRRASQLASRNGSARGTRSRPILSPSDIDDVLGPSKGEGS